MINNSKKFLETQKETKAIIKLQSNVRGWMIRKRLSVLNKEELGMLRIRASAFSEFIRDEKKNIDSLQRLMNVYIIPIKQQSIKFNLGETAVNYLSGNIKSLKDFHEDFYEKLCNLRNHELYPVVLNLGDLMNEESANLRAVHMSYANNYVSSIETLRHLQSSISRFQTFISDVSNIFIFNRI